jgi:hypothetical protein
MGWPMARGSKLKPVLDELIQRSTEMGIINRIFEEEIIKTKSVAVRPRLRASEGGILVPYDHYLQN